MAATSVKVENEAPLWKPIAYVPVAKGLHIKLTCRLDPVLFNIWLVQNKPSIGKESLKLKINEARKVSDVLENFVSGGGLTSVLAFCNEGKSETDYIRVEGQPSVLEIIRGCPGASEQIIRLEYDDIIKVSKSLADVAHFAALASDGPSLPIEEVKSICFDLLHAAYLKEKMFNSKANAATKFVLLKRKSYINDAKSNLLELFKVPNYEPFDNPDEASYYMMVHGAHSSVSRKVVFSILERFIYINQ